MSEIVSESHRRAAQAVRELMATYRAAEDLIQLGAYLAGSSAAIDRAIERHPLIRGFLIQPPNEPCTFEQTMQQLEGLA